ncbi:MAG TPA: type 1 glutamine amidotransferase domain-containing protein [Planctomycetota bacterium]|nr:type 1 glutamine amidotransferase domain-containing protein [Planctomycetota bacterium]
MSQELQGMRVAILITDGFEQIEMTEPHAALRNAGARTAIVSPAGEKVQGVEHGEKREKFTVDVPLSLAHPEDYDALVLPGGVANPDRLRIIPEAVNFVRAFVDAEKPIAAICHGPWMLIEADAVRGKRVTSWPSVRTDLKNAGALWTDRDAVIDGNLLTSRKPADLPVFNLRMIEVFAEAAARLHATA